MDPQVSGFYSPVGIPIEDQNLTFFSDRHILDTYSENRNLPEDSSMINTVPSSTVTSDEDPHDDFDCSDAVLKYINKILMEEDMDDKTCMLQGSLNLRAEEKSFYDVIGQKYPPSPEQIPSFFDQNRGNGTSCGCNANNCLIDPNRISGPRVNRLTNCNDTDLYNMRKNICFDQNYETMDGYACWNRSNGTSRSSDGIGYLVDTNGIDNQQVNCGSICKDSDLHNMNNISYFDKKGQTLDEQVCCNPGNATSSSCNSSDCLVGTNELSNCPIVCNDSDSYNITTNGYLRGGSESVWQFEKGVEEANKFLPNTNGISTNFEVNREEEVKVEKREEEEYSPTGSRGRKSSHRDDEDLESERISKQAAVFRDPTLRSEMFDTVLLCSMGEGEAALQAYRELLRNGTDKKLLKKSQPKPKGPIKGRTKKHTEKKEVVDLRTLLMSCAQAVASDDRRVSTELLKQIRHHASAFGDGNQRLAHCFADGLEARLAGTGSSIYKSFVSRRTIASDYLKAYHLYLACCPFRKISHMASNKTIMDKSVGCTSIHIIDFGILYGFQWPTLIQRVACRKSGTPRLRITGIEFPQSGFRPASGVEETGRRLADYAKTFDVPFEYNAIAKNWDSIRIEDLKIEKDEYLVVNSLYRFKNLHDETVLKKSSRTIVLDLIKRINPDLFILGILNGSYGAPFFVTRFREALFHFSALFDMLETNVPREHHERMLIEREIFGKEAMNVIACEGWERIERPETYKQWQVRNLRAGFTQVPFSNEVIDKATMTVRTRYHKDFLIDKDSRWLIQGWKGRITYALSCWVPV